MAPDNPNQASDRSRALLKRLNDVRLATATEQVGVRKEQLLAELKESVAGLPQQDSDQVLSQLRDDLIGEARERDRTIHELREQVHRLEGEVADLQAAASHLENLPNIGPVTMENGYLHIEANLEDAERISAHLAQASIYPRRIEPVGSDLEDFFMDLTASETADRVQ